MKNNSQLDFFMMKKRRKNAPRLTFLGLIVLCILRTVPPIMAQSGETDHSSSPPAAQAPGSVPSRTAPNDSLKGSLRLGAEMQFQTGNIDRFMIRANATGDVSNTFFSVKSSVSYSLHQIFGMQLENDWFGFADLRLFPDNTFFPIAFGEFESSNLRFLELRVQGGVGAGINIVRSPLINLSLSTTFTYDQTRFRIANSYEGWRYSFHLFGNYVLFDGKVIVTHNFFSQPTALFTSNYRHRLIAMIMIPITRNLSISSTLDYSYESVVDETRKPTNIFNAIGITWSF